MTIYGSLVFELIFWVILVWADGSIRVVCSVIYRTWVLSSSLFFAGTSVNRNRNHACSDLDVKLILENLSPFVNFRVFLLLFSLLHSLSRL